MKGVIAGATAAILLVLTLPPLALAAGRGEVTWFKLAEIGQAYGGVAAIVSGLALVGVAPSLLLQWRQTRLLRHSYMQIFGSHLGTPMGSAFS